MKKSILAIIAIIVSLNFTGCTIRNQSYDDLGSTKQENKEIIRILNSCSEKGTDYYTQNYFLFFDYVSPINSFNEIVKSIKNVNDAKKVCDYRAKHISDENIIKILNGKETLASIRAKKLAKKMAYMKFLKKNSCKEITTYGKLLQKSPFALKGICINTRKASNKAEKMMEGLMKLTKAEQIQLMGQEIPNNYFYKIIRILDKKSAEFVYERYNKEYPIIFVKKNGYIEKDLNIKYAKFTGTATLLNGDIIPIATEIK